MSPAANSVVTQEVVTFLEGIPPFEFLSTSDLRLLARKMTLEYFPRDTVILNAGGKALESLYVIQKGAVKLAIRTATGKQLTLEMRSDGEVFGLLSLMGGAVARMDVIAVEDTLCYSIPAAEIQYLRSSQPEFADFFVRTSIMRLMDRSLRELREQTHLMGDSERLLYSLCIEDVVRKPALTCGENTSIRAAAQIASAERASCLFVTAADGHAVGIVTDRDFAAKVVAAGLSPDLRVTAIMSSPVVSLDSRNRVFEALIAMLNHDIEHVLITEEDHPKAVLTNADVTLLQGKSPVNLVRHLDQQCDVEGLAAAQQRINALVPLLLREGAKASHITCVMGRVNDRLIAKILELAVAELGPPAAPYCWVVMGSEGRSEQTFKTDQDNGLIYADAGDHDIAAQEYFGRMAQFVCDAMVRCGYPQCSGGYMATNPRWRGSLRGWQDQFAKWIYEADLASVQHALIFFDMRPAGGDATLYDALAAHNRRLLEDAGLFKSVLAHLSIENKPPIGFFRTFVVERSGVHKQELDLKLSGTGPIVNAARLFALTAGIEHTNTVDRLSALASSVVADHELFNELEEAFEFLTLLRLESQLKQVRSGVALSNYVRPETLSHLQRSILREAFQTIARAQSLIQARFRSAVWSQLDW